ncbi:acyltransferase family protein [Rhizobium leguminosarum]|uniref:acyltransferase family protein n=1 Tax=Rhizobium leguminosarum TaxID=384 RepID=UPI003F999F83
MDLISNSKKIGSDGSARNDRFRQDINALRAIAVVAVVLYHFRVPFFQGGFVGVDVFFVISGYLMTQVIYRRQIKGDFSIAGFYASRVRRIVPALFATLAALLVIGLFVLTPLDYSRLARYGASAIGFYSNFVFAGESGYFADGTQSNWLLHTWSLSVEWQFYLLFPLLLIASFRWRRGAGNRVLFLCLGLASLAFSIYETGVSKEHAFYLLPSRSWELLAGGLLFFAPSWVMRIRWLNAVGLVAILVSAVTYSDGLAYPGAWPLLPVAGAVAFMGGQKRSQWIAAAPLQFLGNISYSLYLWHWPVYVGARYLEVPFTPITQTILIALSVAAAWVSYRLIEAPFRGGASHPVKAIQLYGCWAVVMIASVVIIWTDGAPIRLPAETRQMIALNDTTRTGWPFPESCGATMASLQSAPGNFCATGQATDQKVLIWGDSHAEHLYPAVKSLVDDGKLPQVLWATRGGCLPVRGLSRFDADYLCNGLSDLFFQRALEPDVKSVIVASLWMNYVFNVSYYYGYEFEKRSPIVCRGAECGRFRNPDEALAFVQDRMMKDIGELTSRGKHVYLMLPVPAYRVSVPEHMLKNQMLGALGPLSLKLTDHVAYTQPIRSLLMDVAAKTGAILLDPADVLCPGGDCIYEENGVSIYRDAHHLTPVGVDLLKPLLMQAQ